MTNTPDIRTQAIQAMNLMNTFQFPTCLRLLVSETVYFWFVFCLIFYSPLRVLLEL